MCNLVTLIIICSGWSFVAGLPELIRIGGLFHSKDEIEEIAFKYAVENINSANYMFCERRYRHGKYPTLLAQAEKVPEHNSFHVSRKVCQLLKTGIAGIFGPSSQDTSVHVQSVCDAMEIPHVELRWDHNQRRESCSVNLYPHPSSLAKVFVDIVTTWKWKGFTIIYEKAEDLSKMSELLKLNDPKGNTVAVRQLNSGVNYRPVLKDVKNSGTTNIILDCSIEILGEVLKQAQQVGLIASQYNFIITNMDLHTLDLEPFQHSGTNITGISIVDPEDDDVRDAVNRWKEGEMRNRRILNISTDSVRLSVALVNDAVLLFTQALCSFEVSKEMDIKPLDCESKESWADGYSLINYMKSSEVKGMTGVIKFNQGFRTDFNLNLIELTETGLQKIGTWNISEGLNVTRIELQQQQLLNEEVSLVNTTFIVLTALSPPYGMLKEDSRQLTGNARFEGFGIDVIHELSLMLGFNYTFLIQADNKYGNLNKTTEQWNGMIREILEYRADLAITDLTITHDRESAVDFTMPFMNLGISILYKKPMKQPPSLFSFLSPFSHEVWMYMLGAYLGVSVLLFVMARISPYEWNNPYPCIEEPEFLENQFSLKNSLWFTIGSLMQQGSEIAPIAVSTRMVAGIWWFFTLIMVSSYTANLAAFLTIESTTSPFKNVEELAKQKVIKYGAKAGGSTASFFMDSNYSIYKTMADYMKNNPDVQTSSNEEGLARVIKENYAFLMESTSIEYIVERNCDVTQIGGLLDNKGYGIAMRKNSTYRNSLSTAVLNLQETGKLTALKRKWWKEKRGGGACGKDAEKSGEASELDLDNVGGVFVVLVAGVFVACFITLFEMLYSIRETTRKEKVSFKAELMEELRFVAKCHGSTKPVRKRKSLQESNGEEGGERGEPEAEENRNEHVIDSSKYGWLLDKGNKT